uniref:UPAR/Ly6 domain-containing protein n=1 Tax=Mola mola TaxID=94237 RepID=A0A3Q3WH07_MOLML
MRAAVCSILLLMALYQGEALRCNFCYSKGGGLCTATSVQTCAGLTNACGAVILPAPFSYSFRQCMDMTVCQGFIKTQGVIANCCSTDLSKWLPHISRAEKLI